MTDEQIEQEQPTSQTIGKFDNYQIDQRRIAIITFKEQEFLNNLEFSTPQGASATLKGILSDMQSVLQKYFSNPKDKIVDYRIDINGLNYNFYELKQLSSMNLDNIDLLRAISEGAFNIFEKFMKDLKVAMATSKIKKNTKSYPRYSL